MPPNTSNTNQIEESGSHVSAVSNMGAMTGSDASSDEKEVFFDGQQFSDDQYYNYNDEGCNAIENSQVLYDKKRIALALYTQPDHDEITIKHKPKPGKENMQFKLKKFELNENGYIAGLENGSEIITIKGKNAYVVTPDFMDSKIERKVDSRVGIDSGILGYGNGAQAVRFNVMVMFDAAIEIDNLFKVEGSCLHPIVLGKNLMLSAAKKRVASAGCPIGSKQKDYTQFVVSENTLKIVVTKTSAIEMVYSTVAEILGKFCEQKVQVDGKESVELNLTQKDIFISGAALNKAQDVAINTARIKVLVGDNVSQLEARVEPPQGEEVRGNVKLLEAKTEQLESEKVRRWRYLKKKFEYAVDAFGKAGTRSNHPKAPEVPKEQQLSIDLGNKPVFGIISKILHWVENKFKYFFPRYNLFREVGNKDRKIPGTNSEVKYFTSDEKAEHTMYLGEEDGEIRLYNAKGELYDTTNTVSKGKKGYVAFVITLDGRLIVHEHVNVGKSKYAYRHSTLAGGEPVLCSGLMIVKNGKIEYIDNNSGHYKPRSANIYNTIIRFKAAFSKDAKVVHFGGWFGFIKEIPILCRIVPGKKESIDGFQKRMETKGKSGLTKVEECFENIREYNKQYEQKLFLGSYKSPTSEPPNNPAIHKKHKVKLSSYIKHCKFLKEFDEDSEVKRRTIEHSIRKIIGIVNPYTIGHMPRIKIAKEVVSEDGKVTKVTKTVGINVIFYYREDYERFIKLLDDEKCHYKITTEEKQFKVSDRVIKAKEYIIFMDEISADKFIKNTLKIDRSTGTILSDLELLCAESNSRTI